MLTGSGIIQRVIAMMPGQEAVTLGSRQPRETGYTDVAYANARRCPATDDDVLMSGASREDVVTVFELYRTTESVAPKVGDKITDAVSVVHQVKNINVKMQRTNFRCQCIQNK